MQQRVMFQTLGTVHCRYRPLKNASPKDLAQELLQIFQLFGFPAVLRNEGAIEIIEAISAVNLHEAMILPGQPKPNVADTIREELESFCTEHGMSWPTALQFFAYHKNCLVLPGKEISAYQAVFSREPKAVQVRPATIIEAIPEDGDAEALRIFEEIAAGEGEQCPKRALSPDPELEPPTKTLKPSGCQCTSKCIQKRCPCRASGVACGDECHTVPNLQCVNN